MNSHTPAIEEIKAAREAFKANQTRDAYYYLAIRKKCGTCVNLP